MRVAVLILAVLFVLPVRAQDRPNIVLIISDDQAWTDHGFMGHPHIRTPNIDRLASEGLTFTRGYVTAPLCRPSLASIATGLFPHQHGITGNDPAFAFDGRRYSEDWYVERSRRDAPLSTLFAAQSTLPELLGEADYVSLQTGKWWEGSWEDGGFTSGMTHGDPARGGRHGDAGLDIGREGMQEIADFIQHATTEERPFFLWYAPFLPHTPHTPPDSLLEKYRDAAPTEPVASYWAMCEWFDATVGQLLELLEQKGLSESTLVVYVVDNGWVQDPERGNRYLSPSKRSPYDLGIRTPIIYRRPGHIDPRLDTTSLASSIDIAPTVLHAAGLEPPAQMNGLNAVAPRAVAGRSAVFSEDFSHDVVDVHDPRKSLQHRVLVTGHWKLIAVHDATGVQGYELYHILQDPFEKNDLSDERGDVVRELAAKLDQWWTP